MEYSKIRKNIRQYQKYDVETISTLRSAHEKIQLGNTFWYFNIYAIYNHNT